MCENHRKNIHLFYSNEGTHTVLVMCTSLKYTALVKHCRWNARCILDAVLCWLQSLNQLKVTHLSTVHPQGRKQRKITNQKGLRFKYRSERHVMQRQQWIVDPLTVIFHAGVWETWKKDRGSRRRSAEESTQSSSYPFKHNCSPLKQPSTGLLNEKTTHCEVISPGNWF